jgi:hypothetical protein
VKTREAEFARLIDEVLSSFDLCVSLLGSAAASSQLDQTTQLVERASQCLILMLQLYALRTGRKREIYFTELHVTHLVAILKAILQGSTPQQLSAQAQSEKKVIVKRLLKCVYWALIQSEYRVRLKPDRRLVLETQVSQLMQVSDDRSVQNTTREIYKILRSGGGGGEIEGSTGYNA